ncbi:MAG: hypothetical protein HYV93_25580 [Candidatus Rokubacteria bacterium]|nr:hypothetical protein [Candidatus Rokubacteria bacterium]
MSGLLILTAVELETAALARRLEFPRLSGLPFRAFGRGDVRLAAIGPRASLLAERWYGLSCGLHAPLVVSAGLCGALDPHLRVGDLVLPEAVLAPSGELLRVNAQAHGLLLARAGGRARAGRLVTICEVAATPEAKASLRAGTGAVAVDMESAPILTCAEEAGWPSLVVRGVSDEAAHGVLPALSGLVGADGRLHGGRALALALTHPGSIAQAVALRRGSRLALGAVARSLAALMA